MTHPDLAAEQAYLDQLYARLDDEIAGVEARLTQVRYDQVGGHHQSRQERDAFAQHLEERHDRLRSQRRDDLCFGRIDMADGQRFYIGRTGIADDDLEPLLLDWRAPAAAPFYQATPRNQQGVVRRRHFLTRGQRIAAIEDEVLDAGAVSTEDAAALRGEAALVYAMNTARTGRMQEIAATIQREQDEIIRASMTPAVFVQGGPGTGKTAVALHRAAYLLYTHRRQLSASDVLVIGPNALFLRYIEHVLPSLGENGAELTAIPDVYRRRPWEQDDPARAVKSRLVMVELLERAIAIRERPLTRSVEIGLDGRTVTVRRGDTHGIVASARRRPGVHNRKALAVHDRLLRMVCRKFRKAGVEWEFAHLKEEVADLHAFRRLVARVWPVLRPEELVGPLFGFPALLREAAAGLLPDGDVALLAREWPADLRDVRWTRADAPLLDEAARQLGPVPPELDPHARRSRQDQDEATAEAEYVRQSLRGLGGGMVSRSVLEERMTGSGPRRGGGDDDDDLDVGRSWRYAVVDEAQDLSPMEWRMVGRHASRRAITVVGDVAQGTEAWSPHSWEDVAEALGAGDEARRSELTINYRTPSEISEWAAGILAVLDPGLTPPTAIRSAPGSLVFAPVPPGSLASGVAAALTEGCDAVPDGVACVVATESAIEAIRREVEARTGRTLPDLSDPAALEAPVLVMTPALAKGLEFDVVVVAEPHQVIEECGWRALYVSATRATQRLAVVHTTESPLPPAP